MSAIYVEQVNPAVRKLMLNVCSQQKYINLIASCCVLGLGRKKGLDMVLGWEKLVEFPKGLIFDTNSPIHSS